MKTLSKPLGGERVEVKGMWARHSTLWQQPSPPILHHYDTIVKLGTYDLIAKFVVQIKQDIDANIDNT